MNKRGNIPVFIAIITATLMSLTLMLVYAAREECRLSAIDGILNLAGDSVLSEYDRYVYEEYGIFLLGGSDKELNRRLNRYVDYSFDHVNPSLTTARFSTVNTDVVKLQIIEHMKSPAGKLLREKSGSSTFAGDATNNGNSDSYGRPLRTLRHGPTIVSLPSSLIPDSNFMAKIRQAGESMKNPRQAFKAGTDNYLINRYVLSSFNSAKEATDENHFFSNEVEYILFGKLSDEGNSKQTTMALKALRTPLNLAHIYASPEKMAAITAAAEIITPGVLGTVTTAGIASVWALCEADNDVKLLRAGYKVPFAKTDASWAIDLDSVMEGLGRDYILPNVITGYDYEDYLMILLFIEDDDIKTARIMDLIQINVRKNHNGSFLIGECTTGISVKAVLKGKTLSYDKTYFKQNK